MRGVIEVFHNEVFDIISARMTKKNIFGWIMLIIMFGVFIPMSQAPFWISESQFLSFHLVFIPLMITYACVAYSFARSREGKQYSASKFNDTTVFLGKGLACFLFSYIFYIFVVIIGILSLNYFIYMSGEYHRFFMYSPPAIFSFMIGGAGLVLFALGTGTLISLKSESVKRAQLWCSVIYLFIGVPVFSGLIKLTFTWDFVIPVTGILILTDAMILAFSMRMYKRSKFIYDRVNSIYDG